MKILLKLLILSGCFVAVGSSDANEKTRLLVSEFKMTSKSDMPYLGKYLAEEIIYPLIQSQKFELARTILIEPYQSETDAGKQTWLDDLADLYQADVVLVGSVSYVNKSVKVTLALVDTASGKVRKKVFAYGEKMNPIIEDLVAQLVK